jgi:hypothetical protein
MDDELNVKSDMKIKPGSMLSKFVFNPEAKGDQYNPSPYCFYFTDKERKHIVYKPILNDGTYVQTWITDLNTQEEVQLPDKLGDLTITYSDIGSGEYGDGLVRMRAWIYNEKTDPDGPNGSHGDVYVNSKGEIVKYTLDEK